MTHRFFILQFMWFPDLAGKAPVPESSLIIHGWAELFGEDTQISYTPKLQDSVSLIAELKDVAERAQEDARWQKHVPDIVEELQAVAEKDSVLARFYPQVLHAISQIPKTNERSSRVCKTAAVLIDILADYEEKISEYFRETLGLLPKEKGKALGSLQQLATRAVQKGFAREEVRSLVDEAMFEHDAQQVAESLIAGVTPRLREWTCIISIIGDTSEIESMVNSIGYRRMPAKDKPLGAVGKKFNENLLFLDKNSTFQVIASVEAAQQEEAIQKIINPLRVILDVANFTHRSAQYKIHSSLYIKTDNFEDVIDVNAGAYAGIEPQSNAANLTVDYQKKGLLDRLPERIITTLEQHSVAHLSTDPKQRFVNLWVALETLVRSESGTSAIDEIVRQINPLIIHRRVNNIIKYLAISLWKYGFCDTIKDIGGWFSHSKKFIRRDELLLVLTGAAGQPVAHALAKDTLDHPLLCYRLYEVYREMSDRKEMLKKLRQSRKRSEWQLKRIYRTRNILVHRGESMPHLSQLTTHLEYYYSLTLSRILHDFQTHGNWSVEKSFEARRQMYYYVEHCIENGSNVTVNDILQRGDSYLGEESLWK